MTDEIQFIEALEARAVRRDGRRAFFKAALSAAAVGAGGMAVANAVQAATTAPTELDVLNFALNLEYLEANFYSLAVYGTPIATSLIGTGTSTTGAGGVAVAARAKVDFGGDAILQAIATEIAEDEIAHVTFLRKTLGTAAVAQPQLELGVVPSATSPFSVAAQKAGVVAAGAVFDPFSSLNAFLLGAFLFEDVGASAYRGAQPALTTAAYLTAAAGLMSVEAQHAAAIRTAIYVRGVTAPPTAAGAATYTPATYLPAPADVAVQAQQVTFANQISDARDALDGPTADLDQGIQGVPDSTQSNIAPLDGNGLGIARTAGQVLNVVYLKNTVATSGGFFPNGVNGLINSSTAAA